MEYKEIKKLLKVLGWSMSELSAKVNVSRPTLQRMLENPRSMTIDEIERISSLLKIDKDILLK